MATSLFSLRRHSSAGWNPGNGGAVVNGWPILADGALGGHPLSCHSRCAGMDCLNHWIPAFAGMTVGAVVGIFSGMAKGLSGWRQTHSNPHRHSSAGWNPGGRRRGGEWVADFSGWRVVGSPFSGHSRVAGMYGLNHWIPACAGMTQWLRGMTEE